MRGSVASFLLLLITTCCVFLITHARSQDRPAASCVPKERDALLDLKHVINDSDSVLAEWQWGRDCCWWLGVTCSHRSGNVLQLDLSRDTLGFETFLAGQVSSSLLALEHLEYLDLSGISDDRPDPKLPNMIRFPEFLGSMKNLRYLKISGGVLFYGSIPPQLGNLSKLEYLDLSLASISVRDRVQDELGNLSNLQRLGLGNMQYLYSLDISWLTGLHRLEYLDMSYVNLSMVADDWPQLLNRIPSLKVLNLANCLLPRPKQIMLGHLNLTKIVQLDLSFNYLGHPLASCWFWNVTTVESLVLSATYLYGPFPTALGSLTSLRWLDFRDNANAATMPVDLKDLCALEYLRLGGSLSQGNINDLIDKLPQCTTTGTMILFHLDLSNNHLTGAIPSGIANIIPFLYSIDLSGNNLIGPIPPAIRNATSLDTLILRSNQLSGQIPILPTSLTKLDVSLNSLSGLLPLDFGTPNLRVLVLSSNYITGNVPQSICELEYMVTLDLSNNFLEGTFPQCSTTILGMSLFLLSNNNFYGEIPSFLSRSIMAFMDISWNKFCGTLPLWIGDMQDLVFLQLSHNMFYGHIPVSITNLRKLRYLNLASNNISGTIPWSLSNLTAMTRHPILNFWDFVNSYSYGEHGFVGILSVVMKRQELNYGFRIFEVTGMDLSINHLTGGIPDEITCLDSMLILNLSWNKLSGEIPEQIGVIRSLESLDLSLNNLSGEIPQSLTNLTYLSCLDLSHNRLTGRIPSGGQLDTLYTRDSSMYDGNHGLCGPPLDRNCSGSKLSEQGNQKASEEESMFFYLGLGSGFTACLWIVFCTMLFKKTWRIAYFRLFDKIYDKVYVFMVVSWGKLARDVGTD